MSSSLIHVPFTCLSNDSKSVNCWWVNLELWKLFPFVVLAMTGTQQSRKWGRLKCPRPVLHINNFQWLIVSNVMTDGQTVEDLKNEELFPRIQTIWIRNIIIFPARAHSLGGLAADAGAYPGETAVSGCGSRVAAGKSDTVWGVFYYDIKAWPKYQMKAVHGKPSKDEWEMRNHTGKRHWNRCPLGSGCIYVGKEIRCQ